MVIFLDKKPRRVRRWHKNHVYWVCEFRRLRDKEQATTDPQEKKIIRFKMQHPQKKVEQHMEYGKHLGIPEDQMRNFNLAIIGEIAKGKGPKAIIQTLIKENGQK